MLKLRRKDQEVKAIQVEGDFQNLKEVLNFANEEFFNAVLNKDGSIRYICIGDTLLYREEWLVRAHDFPPKVMNGSDLFEEYEIVNESDS